MRAGILFVVLLFSSFSANINFVFAQAPPAAAASASGAVTSYTFTRITPEGKFLVQHVAWKIDSSAYNYDVEIEIENESGGYSPRFRKETEFNYIEESLAPGTYRMRVTPFDVIGHRGQTADWTYFSVDMALDPNLSSFSPKVFYLDDDINFVLTLYGRLIFNDSEAWLVPHSTNSAAPRIKPLRFEAEPSGGRARLYFDKDQLVIGSYDIYLKNPRGFDSMLGTFRITFKKTLEFNISASYSPLFPLTLEDDGPYFADSFIPAGFLLNAGIIPVNSNIFDIGFELRGGYNFISVSTNKYDFKGELWTIDGRLLIRRMFPNKTMAVNLKAGGGIGWGNFGFTFSNGYVPKTENSNYFFLAAGLSYQWFFIQTTYIEAGADYVHHIAIDALANDYIKPYLSLGWRF